MKIIQQFQYLIATTTINNIDTSSLNKFAKKIFNEEPSIVANNSGGYQSSNLLGREEVKDLSEKIQTAIRPYTGYFTFKNNLKLCNMWLNVNDIKDSNTLHDNPFTKLSGVFYSHAPENCGNLLFSNPVEIQHFINSNEINKYNSYNSSKYQIIPQNNMVVVFPSFLKHEVAINTSKSKRISFSFSLM